MSHRLNRILKKVDRDAEAEFYPYAGIKHSIRKRGDRIYIRVSDLFADAPEEVLLSLGRILLAKLNKKQIDENDRKIYYEYMNDKSLQEKASKTLAKRKRKVKIIKGQYRDLDVSFERVNRKYFEGSMKKPGVTWSARRAKRTLGRYDPERDVVFISRMLDSPNIPEELVDFIMYHELLHKKHGVTVKKNRRQVHTPEFKRDEKKFHNYEKMKKLMEKLAAA